MKQVMTLQVCTGRHRNTSVKEQHDQATVSLTYNPPQARRQLKATCPGDYFLYLQSVTGELTK